MTAVTVSREQRDVLRGELALEVGCVLDDLRGPASNGASLNQLADLRQRAEVGMRLLDDLGWELHGSRDTYSLSVPRDPLNAWLRWRRAQIASCLEDAAQNLADPWRAWGRYPQVDLAEEVTYQRQSCDRDLDMLAVCDLLLGQLEAAQ